MITSSTYNTKQHQSHCIVSGLIIVAFKYVTAFNCKRDWAPKSKCEQGILSGNGAEQELLMQKQL